MQPRVPVANFNPICSRLRRSISRFLIFILILICASLLTGTLTHAAPTKDFRRKPIAPEVKTKVLRGRKIVIRLPGVESNGNPIRYEIVTSPRSGKLSSLEQPDPNRQGHGFVTYTHGDDEESIVDEFQYRVVTPINGLTSSPGKVTVLIVDLPPQLGAESSLFCSAFVGESAAASLALTNIGGGILHGTVRVRPPFYLDSEGAFELPRGQSTNIALRFTPTETGLTAPEKIQPTREDLSTSITMRGEGTAPFAVKTTSEKLNLKADDSRSLAVEVVNLSTQPQEISVAVDPPELLENIPAFPLAPGKSQEISLHIPSARKSAAENFTVVFSNSVYSLRRNFSAPAVPARLEIRTPELDFTQEREATLVVENRGGVDGDFSITLPVGLNAIEGAATFNIAPGHEKAIRLRLKTKNDEMPPTELHVITPSGETERVALRTAPLEIPEPTPTPTPVPAVVKPVLPGVLNDNVKLTPQEDHWRVEWNLPQGWSDVRLEKFFAGLWTPVSPPPPPVEHHGWFTWLTNIPSNIIGFFSGIISRLSFDEIQPDMTAVKPVSDSLGMDISTADATAGMKWRLMARAPNAHELTPATEEFTIDAAAHLLNAFIPAEAVDTGVTTPPTEETSIQIVSSQQKPEQTSCTVLLAIPFDPKIDGFRLERLGTVTTFNTARGVPQEVEFQVIPHEGRVEMISQFKVPYEGNDLTTVTFTIDGLAPNSGTFWRLVPQASGRDLPPSNEFLVTTLPPWRLTWATSLFWLSIATLASLAFLRWKSRRLPS